MRFITFILIFFITISLCDFCFSQDINKDQVKDSISQSQSGGMNGNINEGMGKNYLKKSLFMEVTEQPWRHPERVKYIWMGNVYIFIFILFLSALRPRINNYMRGEERIKIIE